MSAHGAKTTPLALALAERSSAVRFVDLPPEAIFWAKIGILDTVGVTLAGSSLVDPTAAIVERVLHSSVGQSLIFGSTRRTGALDAAMINGTASHSLDFDDCNNTLGGHPSVAILPALFALADERKVSGEAFIAAYVAGFETECKISLGVNFYQYTHGWHPTATIGVFGGAAACAHLLALDPERTATALAIAASLASGIKANLGTMTKPLHVGQCARSALFAALLAGEGFSANLCALEASHGYFEVFNGPGNYDADKILPAWGAPFDIVRPGIAIKQYPCCASTHPAIDALLELVFRYDLRPENVERIEAWIHPRRLNHTNRPLPNSSLDAKFSLQYCLARALVDRAVRVDHFEGESFRDSAVAAILPRIAVAPYTERQFPASNHFAGEVKITTREGKMHSARVDQALGRSIDKPLPESRLRDKFEGCARRVLAEDRVTGLYQSIRELERLDDLRTLTTTMAAGVEQDRMVSTAAAA